MSGDGLSMWTVYYNPTDAPGLFVVRRFNITKAGAEASRVSFSALTLRDARSYIPPGLHNLGREPGDEPQIVETWV